MTHRHEHREAKKMRRQRNTPQMKQQEKTPKNELNDMEANNLPKTEFKIMVIRMLKELKRRTY